MKCDTVWSGRYVTTFEGSLLLPSSEYIRQAQFVGASVTSVGYIPTRPHGVILKKSVTLKQIHDGGIYTAATFTPLDVIMFTVYLTTFCVCGPTASNCEETVNRDKVILITFAFCYSHNFIISMTSVC
jgi:hypothetical protein